MNLNELIQGATHHIKIEVTGEMLQAFANDIAETTAKRIIAALNSPDEPLSEKEVCKQLGKSRQSLSKYRKEGKLRYHRIGREIYYFPSQLKQDMQNF